jgi:branched-subunit amino acid aminotransferase/4-amino-4-deoxychorismate lyase
MKNSTLHTTLAWANSDWIPYSEVGLSLDDVGVMQGVVLVDRLRTIGGIPWGVSEHVSRLLANCHSLGVKSPEEGELTRLIMELADRNRHAFAERDFSVVTLITPGRLSDERSQPTVIHHVAEIPWQKLAHWYSRGQRLVVAKSRNVPSDCWSPTIKTRARLQYFLADRQAEACSELYAGGLLLDLKGNITETSAANVLIVENQSSIVSPPLDCILNGVCLRRTLRLAEEVGFKVRFEQISLARAQAAQEVLLTGSTSILWPASGLGQSSYKNPARGEVFAQLSAKWMEELGFNYVHQAVQIMASTQRSGS